MKAPKQRFCIEDADCFLVLRSLYVCRQYLEQIDEERSPVDKSCDWQLLKDEAKQMADLHRRLTNRLLRRRDGKR